MLRLIIYCFFVHIASSQEIFDRSAHLIRVNSLYDTLDNWWSTWEHPELNEGIYTDENTTYDEAIENVYTWWNQAGHINNGTRVFEIGFGYGLLGASVVKHGGTWSGINNNLRNVEYARDKLGLDAHFNDWRHIPDIYKGQFDVVFVKGCIEHFIYHIEAIEGKSEELYFGLFKNLTELLDPASSNKRIVVSMMQYRQPVDPRIFLKKYSDFPAMSDPYYWNIINRWWGGHYPNSLEEVIGGISKLNMMLTDYVDDTKDYYFTSRDWSLKMWADLFTFSFMKNIPQLFTDLLFANDKDEAYMSYSTQAWLWQWTPRRDLVNFRDTPCINARWVIRDRDLISS